MKNLENCSYHEDLSMYCYKFMINNKFNSQSIVANLKICKKSMKIFEF